MSFDSPCHMPVAGHVHLRLLTKISFHSEVFVLHRVPGLISSMYGA